MLTYNMHSIPIDEIVGYFSADPGFIADHPTHGSRNTVAATVFLSSSCWMKFPIPEHAAAQLWGAAFSPFMVRQECSSSLVLDGSNA